MALAAPIYMRDLLGCKGEDVRAFLGGPAAFAEKLSRGRWVRARHLEVVSEVMQRTLKGNVRAIINMPPRHGKSELVSKYTPAWFLSNRPDGRVILASYEAQFAASWGRKVRNLVQEHADKVGFSIAQDSSSASMWSVSGTDGGMMTAGVGGPVTGKGADLLIIDDPVKNAEQASSPVYRQKAIDWYDWTAYPRLEPNGSVVIVMTRWHEDDLAGKLLKASPEGWESITLPAIAEADDPLGRLEGEALWPERYPVPVLESIRTTIGSEAFVSLYQCRPQAPSGNIVKREWWKYYTEKPVFSRIIHSWDTAFKAGQGSDYSVCTVWGEAATGFYLLNVWRQRVEFPELKRASVALYDHDKPSAVLTEDAASGQSLIQELRRDTKLPVLAVKVDKEKTARLTAITPLIEAGKVLLPERATWLADYVDELSAFPNGEHDDQVDSTSQALAWLTARRHQFMIG
jgi:predicted phage terminase large subunit-like protein